jgi:hypothetical protein
LGNRFIWTQKKVDAGSATFSSWSTSIFMELANIEDEPKIYFSDGGSLVGKTAADEAQIVDGGSLGEPLIGDRFQLLDASTSNPRTVWNNLDAPVMFEKYNYNPTAKRIRIYSTQIPQFPQEWGNTSNSILLGNSYDDAIISGWNSATNTVSFDKQSNAGNYDESQIIGHCVTDSNGVLKNADIGAIAGSTIHDFGWTGNFDDNNGNTLFVINGLIYKQT